MNRRVISILLIVAIAASSLLAGCGKAAAPNGPVKVVWWRSLTGVRGDTQDELVRRFNESQDEVEVEVQFQGSYGELVEKLLAALAADEVPDVVLLDSPFVVLFAKDGVLVPLDDLAADKEIGLDLDDMMQGLISDGYYKGKLYALPLMRSTPLLYYNRDLFKEVGLPDRVPETWDEFKEFCDKLTKVEGGETVRQGVSFTMGRTTAHWYLQAAIYAFGGEVSDEDFNMLLEEPETVAAAQLWQDLVFKYKTGKAGVDEGGSHGDFLNHRAGMVFGSTGSMSSLRNNADFEVGAGMIPEQTRRMVPVGGSVIAMTSTDKDRQEAAWKFMKYMVQPAANYYVVEQTGYLPTSQSSLEYDDMVAYFDQYPERKIALEQLKYARPQATVISLATGTEILRQAVEKLLVGEVPVAQVMAEAAADLRTEYEESFK
ncbi:MAG: ABC transporter substrate-binding protein [Anaerolineae bacterium]|nr:MAG: ABC transporter substrate-binding protein [Anaerolineae bacterium]